MNCTALIEEEGIMVIFGVSWLNLARSNRYKVFYVGGLRVRNKCLPCSHPPLLYAICHVRLFSEEHSSRRQCCLTQLSFLAVGSTVEGFLCPKVDVFLMNCNSQENKVYIVYMGEKQSAEISVASVRDSLHYPMRESILGRYGRRGFGSVQHKDAPSHNKIMGLHWLRSSLTYLARITSFNDEGFGPPPAKWKGTCKTTINFT
ncbi:hypothetical protein L484_005367 [Morus notabilis]|uniref:Uncharacterized protein n=1 Tax=Morus notabilis TaxID=981085 RepID=W9RV48_9ROSA|nr:hypothetical protein L484_005367 [Morus notabilis]